MLTGVHAVTLNDGTAFYWAVNAKDSYGTEYDLVFTCDNPYLPARPTDLREVVADELEGRVVHILAAAPVGNTLGRVLVQDFQIVNLGDQDDADSTSSVVQFHGQPSPRSHCTNSRLPP